LATNELLFPSPGLLFPFPGGQSRLFRLKKDNFLADLLGPAPNPFPLSPFFFFPFFFPLGKLFPKKRGKKNLVFNVNYGLSFFFFFFSPPLFSLLPRRAAAQNVQETSGPKFSFFLWPLFPPPPIGKVQVLSACPNAPPVRLFSLFPYHIARNSVTSVLPLFFLSPPLFFLVPGTLLYLRPCFSFLGSGFSLSSPFLFFFLCCWEKGEIGSLKSLINPGDQSLSRHRFPFPFPLPPAFPLGTSHQKKRRWKIKERVLTRTLTIFPHFFFLLFDRMQRITDYGSETPQFRCGPLIDNPFFFSPSSLRREHERGKIGTIL